MKALLLAALLQAASPVDVRRELHRLAETGNQETRTMAYIAARLRAIGLTEVKTGVAKTGVTAVIRGGRKGRMVAIRAPIDGFPVPEKTGLPFASTGPVSHACGHDAMTAAALGAAERLWARRASLHGDVKLLFQPAEEGAPAGEEGGAPLMVKEGVLAGVSALIGFHVDDELKAGEFGIHEGAVYAGADAFELTVQGAAAHGATPWKGVDAAAVAAQLVSALQLVASRQADVWEPVVLTVGTVQAGVRSNALAGEAKLAGTLRSYTPGSRAKARESIGRIAANVAEAFGAKATLRFTEEIGPVVNDAALTAKLRSALGRPKVLKPMSYADDFSAMSEKVPSFYFQLGSAKAGAGLTHTATYDLDEAAIPAAAELLDRLVDAALAD